MSNFSAKESGLGYLYQARYALFLLLEGPEECELSLETLDDITLGEDGTARELLQTKHTSAPARLTDASPQLWKTIRVWSTHIKDGVVDVPPTMLTLITTAQAPEGGIAAALRPGPRRDSASALQALVAVASASTNQDLKAAFDAFRALSADQQRRLVEATHVMDGSADIDDTAGKIGSRIRSATQRQNRNALFERLEGWWFGRVIDQLRSPLPKPVSGFEVYDKVHALAEQFGPAVLPIDYLEARPDDINPHTDDRMFVRQLRAIDVGLTRIAKAILDYYRAFEQRSRWAREDLLVGDEVESYERRLVDEWQRFAGMLTEDLGTDASEVELRKVGKKIFNWMEQVADLRIRSHVAEPYVMRGSFHILANRPAPSVWWHPRFLERLTEVLTESSAAP